MYGYSPLVQKPRNDVALDLQRTRGNIHHAIEPLIEFFLGLREICNARHVDGDHAHRAGAFAAAEVAAGFLAQLAQIEPQAAAHGTDVRRLHIAVDVVREIRRAVLRGHFKQQLVVFGLGPVEVLGDGIGRDRVLEAAAVGVALDHDLDERLVDHVHLFFAVFVFEVHFLAADDRV